MLFALWDVSFFVQRMKASATGEFKVAFYPVRVLNEITVVAFDKAMMKLRVPLHPFNIYRA